jgi:hypothetical protein
MKIKEKVYLLSLLFESFDQVYQSIDLRIQKFTNLIEFSIQIPSTETRPVVACHHTIWIHHWNYVKIAEGDKLMTDSCALKQRSDETLQHEGGV